MIQAAVRALVNAIDDPYTVYLDHIEYEWFQQDLKGMSDLEWIGAVVAKKDYYILIEEVLKESPAFNAWIRPLDRILAVDGESTKDETVNQAVMRIRGPKDSIVTLTIERVSLQDGSREIFDVEVIRDKISIPSVTSETIDINNKNIWLITISMIGEETENLLRREIIALKQKNIQWVILDLRGNGWGILPIAVEIASHFIPAGQIITTTKYKWFPEEKFTSLGYGDLSDIPVIVLIDWLTASAGEIIALALREQIAATLIGTQSFGKWSIQTLYEFSNKDSLKYTIGRWYGPSGSSIDMKWITPDIIVEFNAELYAQERIDNQLEEAKKVLQTKLR
jgi:carboxyl-terminal processing protease